MKSFEVYYLNYEGNTATMTVEVEDDADACDVIRQAILENQSDGDGIHQVLSCSEIT